jgi:hypothetical protein
MFDVCKLEKERVGVKCLHTYWIALIVLSIYYVCWYFAAAEALPCLSKFTDMCVV